MVTAGGVTYEQTQRKKTPVMTFVSAKLIQHTPASKDDLIVHRPIMGGCRYMLDERLVETKNDP